MYVCVLISFVESSDGPSTPSPANNGSVCMQWKTVSCPILQLVSTIFICTACICGIDMRREKVNSIEMANDFCVVECFFKVGNTY